MKLALVYAGNVATDAEKSLARRLGLLLIAPGQTEKLQIDFYLRYEPEGLSLYCDHNGATGAVRVDFSDAKLNYRLADATRNQNIVKAIGLKRTESQQRLTLLDATAGLGKDAYLIASLGCEVQMLERSPIVHALLEDGLQRGLKGSSGIAEAVGRMRLAHDDFALGNKDLPPVDVVYLDPMFPLRKKSARVKKDMFLLQRLLGSDEDDPKLLEAALRLARKRVVVKRAKLSAYLTARKPDIEFKGSSSRYDVYLKLQGASD